MGMVRLQITRTLTSKRHNNNERYLNKPRKCLPIRIIQLPFENQTLQHNKKKQNFKFNIPFRRRSFLSIIPKSMQGHRLQNSRIHIFRDDIPSKQFLFELINYSVYYRWYLFVKPCLYLRKLWVDLDWFWKENNENIN